MRKKMKKQIITKLFLVVTLAFIVSACQLTQTLAERGDASAQYSLGVMYSNGVHEAKKSYPKAVKWYTKAAEQGHMKAQTNLAILYYLGNGVKKSYKTAAMWGKKSADQGSYISQNNLGFQYENGQGVKKDYIKAYVLYATSADKGHRRAKLNLVKLKNKMSQKDIEKAKKLLE